VHTVHLINSESVVLSWTENAGKVRSGLGDSVSLGGSVLASLYLVTQECFQSPETRTD